MRRLLKLSSSSCAGAAFVLWLVVVVLLVHHDHHHGVVSASASASEASAGHEDDSSSVLVAATATNNRRGSEGVASASSLSSMSSKSSLSQKKKTKQHRPFLQLAAAQQHLQQQSSSIARFHHHQQQQQQRKKNHFQIRNYHLRNKNNKQQLIGCRRRRRRRRHLDEDDEICLSGTEPNFDDEDDFYSTFFGGDDNNYGTVCTCIQGKDNQAQVFASIQAEPDVTNPESLQNFVNEFNLAITQLQVTDEYSCTNACETCVTDTENYCGILSTMYKYTISRTTPGDFTPEDILNILSGDGNDIDIDDLLDEGNLQEEEFEQVCFDHTDTGNNADSDFGKVCHGLNSMGLDVIDAEIGDFNCSITYNNDVCMNCIERIVSIDADSCIIADCTNHWDGANIDTCTTMTTDQEQGLIGPFRPLALIWDEDDTAAASATKGQCTEPPTPAPTGLCLSDEEVDFSDDDFAKIIFAPDYEPTCTCTFESNVGTVIASIGEPDDPMNTTSVAAWVDTFNMWLGRLQVSQEYNCQNDCETCFTVNTDAGTTDLICGTFSTNHRTESQANEGNFTVFDIAQAFDEATIAELLEANSKFYEETCIDYTTGETGKVCFAFDIDGVFPEEGDAPCSITYNDEECRSCILQRSPATTAAAEEEECVIANCFNHLEGANINTCTGEGLIGPFMPIMYVTEELTPGDITLGGDCGEGPPFCLADDEVNFSDNDFAAIVFAPEYEPVCTCTSQDNTAEVIANVGEPSLLDLAAVQAWIDAFNQAIGQMEILNEYDCLNGCETCFDAGSGVGGGNLTTSDNSTNQDIDAAAAVFVMTGACNESDYMRWTEGNGLINQATEADFCALTRLCLVNAQCNTDCFVNEHGYTSPCAACFGAMPSCSAAEGCAGDCYADPDSEDCIECSRPCTDIFFECTGLPRTLPTPAPTPALTDPVGMNNTTFPAATASPSSVAATTTICGIFSTNQREYASPDEGNFTFTTIEDAGETIPNLLEDSVEFYDETCIDYTTGETGKVCFIYDIKGGFPDGDAPCQITYNDDSCTSCVRQVSTEECVVADCTNLLEGANINTCTGEGLSGPFMPIMYVTEELTPDEVTKGNCGFTPAPDTPAPVTIAPVTPTPVAENTTAPTVAPVTPVPADTENTTAPTDAPVTPAPTDSPVTPEPTDAPDTGAPTASKAAAVYQMTSIMVGAMILGCGFYIA